jgi:hypothetical protein
VTDLKSNDLRCNVGASTGGTTTTVSVAAGSSVTFTADTAVYHQGPVSFYMTKVADAATADGSTDWFKIKEIGPTFSGGQSKWDMSRKSILGIYITNPPNVLQSRTTFKCPPASPPVTICFELSNSEFTTQDRPLSSTPPALRSKLPVVDRRPCPRLQKSRAM